MKHAIRYRGGQAVVEFALVGPILALLLMGLIEFGFLFYAHVQVANATREAARAGSLYLSGRFQYTSCSTGMSCPDYYGSGSNDPNTCWPIKDWVENALVERVRQSSGCVASPNPSPPTFNYSSLTPSTAFGLLTSDHCDTAAQMNCWLLQSLFCKSSTSTSQCYGTGGSGVELTSSAPSVVPDPGDELRAKVLYRYRLIFLSGLTGFRTDPIEISKIVVMRVQTTQ